MTASKHPPSRLRRGGALATVAALSLTMMSAVGAASAEDPFLLVDDFEYESGLPTGADGDGLPIGYFTFQDTFEGSSVEIATEASPAPATGVDGNVLSMDVRSTSFAGFIHAFENADVNAWVPQDWSSYKGFTMWLYGQGTGGTLFVDVLENRNPGSTKDDAERWSGVFPEKWTPVLRSEFVDVS